MPDLPDGPNIILLYVDQMRWDAMRCAGNTAIQTPNLDRLAAGGVRFSQAVTTTPVCVAARYCLLTGRRAGEHGRHGNNAVNPEPLLDTVPAMLGHAGYHCYSLGKMHFLPTRRHYGLHHREIMDELPTWNHDDDYLMFLKERGWGHKREIHGVRNLLYCQPQTSPLPQEMHGSWWVGDRMVHFLRANHNRRFFAWLGWIGPHPPFNAPEPWASMYANADVPVPIAVDRDEETMPLILRMLRSYSDYDHATEQRLRRVVALYYATISLIDHQVGRILDTLDELELSENTLVVFTSDHGEMLGDHYMWRKSRAYEPSARVPFLVQAPEQFGLRRASVVDEPCTHADLMPTLLEMAGIPVPDTCDGRSMLPLMRGEQVPWREYVHIEHVPEHMALTDGREKYIWDPKHGSEQFLDLSDDPTECHDLIADASCAERIEVWRGRLIDELRNRPEGFVEGDRLVAGRPWKAMIS